jgi:uncharacterized protein (DUF58 family)
LTDSSTHLASAAAASAAAAAAAAAAFDATQHNLAGLAVAKPPVYVPARDGTPHMFQLHAVVDNISPHTGEQQHVQQQQAGCYYVVSFWCFIVFYCTVVHCSVLVHVVVSRVIFKNGGASAAAAAGQSRMSPNAAMFELV